MPHRALLVLLLVTAMLATGSRAVFVQSNGAGTVRIATYNVEWFLDVFDDPYAKDESRPPKPRKAVDQLAASLRNSGAWTDSQLERLASACFACPLIEASSTRIRASPTGAGTLLHPAVSRYIEEHGLYGA